MPKGSTIGCQGSPPIWFNATCPRLRPLAFRQCALPRRRPQVAAASALLDRGWGKPAQAIQATTTNASAVVMLDKANPVTAGLVASFNRPGGNLTGISMSELVMATKQVEMLHEIVPQAAEMGVILNPTNPL
jgi:ABC transporter substrate binding protein